MKNQPKLPLTAEEITGADTVASGARRDGLATKIDTTLVPYEMVVCVAVALNYGAAKYSPRNYEKGLSYAGLLNSIERHNDAIKNGEELDDDSKLPHHVLLAASVAMLCHNIEQDVIIDDRPLPKVGFSTAELSQRMRVVAEAAHAARLLAGELL